MAATTTSRARPAAIPARGRRADIAGTLRSEYTKIRSLRSTYWALLVLVVASIAWSVAFCAGEASHWAHMTATDQASFDPTQSSVIGLALLGQLMIVVLGALSITSEYSTGMIRTSLTVMPRRGVLYGAKAVVFGAIALVIAFLTSFAAFFIGQALLTSTHAGAALSQPGVLPAVIGSALYVAVCGLFAFGLGVILHSTAGAISAALGLLFLLPQLARALPGAWYADVVRWLPGPGVIAVVTNTQGQANNPPHLFSAWGEFAVFGSYTVILLILGAVLFRKRDA
jgi:ABC-type transport system involved in multi-copper enzyme maturation permease subunit